MEYAYTVVLQPEEDGRFSVTVPALPGCFTEGLSREDALCNAQEAISLYIEALLADSKPLPVDINPAQLIETVRGVA